MNEEKIVNIENKYDLLYQIKSPDFLKDKSIKELNELAKLIREFIIEKVSLTGGHLSANLGVVEATIAMYYVFDCPQDLIIFDVGHQSYVQKILTGRAKDFDRLRQMNGVSGFPKYSESIYDTFETGHSSTSISAMCGFLEEKKTNSNIGEVVSFIGDGSIQNGLSLASLNFLASQKDYKGIIIVNDNEMSISKNVGGITNTFNKLRIKKSFGLVRKLIPVSVRNAIKTIVYRKVNIFNNLGFTYLGPIDGHNIEDMIKYMQYAKKSSSSLILHIKTIKGKGYKFAEEDKIGLYHGIGPFDSNTGKTINQLDENKTTFANGMANIIEDVILENKCVKVICPAMIYGTGLQSLKDKYPDSIIDVGINEEGAVVMASAMARSKAIPIVCTYSTFFQRAYDEINHDVSRTKTHVIFLIDHAGIVSNDGNTHQGIFDISMLYSLPNLLIFAPSNLNEAKSLLNIAIKKDSPVVIRYPKAIVEKVGDYYPINSLDWLEILPIQENNIITYGPVVNEFKELIMKSGKNIGLINAISIKPIDKNMILKLNNTNVYIYEEVIKDNSLASKVIEYAYLSELKLKIKNYGFEVFPQDGSLEDIKAYNGLSLDEILKEIN